MSALATGAKAATGVADVAKMSDELAMLSKVADDTKAFQKALKSGQGFDDISDTSKLLNRVDDETFDMALTNKQFTDNLNNAAKANPKDFKEALSGIQDTNRLADIGKKLDSEAIEALKQVDGGDDLVKKLKPNFLGRVKNTGTKLFRNRTTLANLDEAIENLSRVTKNVDNPPTNIDQVGEIANKIPKNADEAKQADVISKEVVAGNSEDVRKSIKSVNKILKEGSESSNTLRKGLAELGITPGSVAIGAGVIVLLCMAYDTDNPFTAVDRALDDTGKVVKGFKEVADSAATAVKDTAKGGFDFISFVTQNSWISFACSILCVILLFALFMTGMLGSMGGNNRR